MILLYVLNICRHESKLLIKTASKQPLDSLWTTNILISFTITGYIYLYQSSDNFGCAIFLPYTANTLTIRV